VIIREDHRPVVSLLCFRHKCVEYRSRFGVLGKILEVSGAVDVVERGLASLDAVKERAKHGMVFLAERDRREPLRIRSVSPEARRERGEVEAAVIELGKYPDARERRITR